MRISNNAKISRQDTEGQNRQQALGRFFKCSPSVLALPKLSDQVSTRYKSDDLSKNIAILALNLMRNGLIKEDATGEPKELIQVAIQQWINDCVGDLEHFSLKVDVSTQFMDLEHSSFDEDDYERKLAEFSDVTGKSPMFFIIEPDDNIDALNIGEKLQAIEDKVPGLGKTTYYWLATLGARTFEVYTPWMGSSKAVEVWWYGQDNQEDFLESLDEYYGSDDLESLEILGPNEWEESFPKWVTRIENPLSKEDLEAIVKASPESLESKVAEAVLALINNQSAQLPAAYITDLYPAYSGIYLHWEPNDNSNRLIDDAINQINETGGEGYTETLGMSPIPNKKKEFDSWLVEMTSGFNQLKNLDVLINLIGIRSN